MVKIKIKEEEENNLVKISPSYILTTSQNVINMFYDLLCAISQSYLNLLKLLKDILNYYLL